MCRHRSEEPTRPQRPGAARGLWLATLSACLGLVCAAASARVLDPQFVHSATLGNGLRVVVCEDEAAPVVSVAVVVRAGSADERAEESGTAHLLEHLCWVGTREMDPRTVVEDAGGITNAGTLRDFTRFYATVRPEEFETALRAVAAMALRERFDEALVRRERAIILDEAATRMDRPRAALNDLAFEAVYGAEHPYGRHIEGSEDSLAMIDGARLARFHRMWYVPNNMAVIVSGDVGFAAALHEVEAVFGGLRPAALAPRAWPPTPRPAAGGERVVETPLREAYVMAAFVGPAVAEFREVCSSDLLATVLGHPQVGRLGQEVRDRMGLASAVGVDFLTQRERALFGVWAICDAQKVEAVKEAIRGEMARVSAEPVPREELAAAKRLLAAEYAFANETAGDRMGTLGFYEGIDSYRTALQYLSRVEAATPADVARVAGWYAGEPLWVVMRPGDAGR